MQGAGTPVVAAPGPARALEFEQEDGGGLRLRQAAQLLRNTEERVQTIATKTGYASVPAFITAFKKAHGRTPLDYRHAQR